LTRVAGIRSGICPAVPALTLIVAAQFIAAAVLDYYGWLGAAVRPLDAARALGILVLLLGVWLIIR
jgi:bacterial/archaeal transporter family-2 protein